MIRNRRLLAASAALLAGAAAALGAAAAPTPTPTARPRLSGGFGRPRATPVPQTASEGGQSLADVVRASQEARGAAPEKSELTIVKRNLVKDPDKGRLTTSSRVPTRTPHAAPATAATPAPEAGSGAASGAPAAADGEAEWKEIARKDRKAVDDGKARVAELSAAAKKLENDFYAWDDGQYRDRVIKPAWDRTLGELEDAKRSLADAEKTLADLPERARRAGALPGWIRE